jgi:hypothetical protein
MHPAAVPLCRVVKHAREGGATLAPLRILRFGDNPERLLLREIRSPLSSPGGPKAGHTIIFAGLSRPVHPGGSIPWSLPWPGRGTRSVAAATRCLHEVGAWQPAGLGQQGEGRPGYAPQRPPAPTQAGESPWPRCWFGTRASPLHESLPERARLHHHVGHGGSGTLHLVRITTSGRRHRAIINHCCSISARGAAGDSSGLVDSPVHGDAVPPATARHLLRRCQPRSARW